MNGWARSLGKWVVVALIAGAAVAIEVAPTLAVSAPEVCARIAATVVAHSSCLASAYGEAQRLGGPLPGREDGACASDGVL